jgi:phosphoribosylaminoimidazole-succinocarboxamide synthase
MQSLDESGHVQVLDDVDLPLPGRSVGKVRVSYRLPDGRLLFVTTDRLSAFDRVVAVVPHKGQVLNELAWWWFANTKDIVANHALSKPHPNALVAREARPLPVEVVVRGHITGVTSTSLWKQYEAGARVIYGHKLPQDLRKNARLPEAIITPTTKAEAGQHDSPLTCAEVVDRGLVAPALWEEVKRTALALFSRGQEVARDAGLVLADTKYEFGLSPDNELMLIDEVHTPDSSRFWEARSLVDRYMAGLEPVSMDKEIIRRALAEAGYAGDGPVPPLSAEVLGETSRRYIETYEKVTGTTFVPATEPVADRLRADLGDIAGWGA